jgi:hypothetical protein
MTASANIGGRSQKVANNWLPKDIEGQKKKEYAAYNF